MVEARFAIPGDLATPTGGYAYDRELLARLPDHGIAIAALALPDSFPEPGPADLDAAAAAFASTPERAVLLVDGLAYGALPRWVMAAAGERPIVALVHHPLGLETGLAPERAAVRIESEREALDCARHVVATSRFTADLLAERFGVEPARLSVAEPGTEPVARVLPRPGAGARLIAVGAVTPRKGYDTLIRALAGLADLDWRLTIVGALDRAPDHVAQVRALVAEADPPGRVDLGGRIDLAGTASDDTLARLYHEADIAVSASLFEGYGMALTEALARGLPLVAATGGAAIATVPDAAALKVPPGDVAALAGALRALIAAPALRATMAEAAWQAGQRLPRWSDTAATMAEVIRTAAAGRPQ